MKNDAIIHIALPEKLKEMAKEQAKAKNISLNSLTRIILTEYLERNKKNEV